MMLKDKKEIIKFIRKSFKNGNYIIKKHAQERASIRGINMIDIRKTVMSGKVIEDYPKDKRGHSCLIEGKSNRQSIRIVCGISTKILAIITVYKPNKK